MDTFAHGLWTYAIFHRKKYVWLATLFGILPDLLSFGPFFMINLFNGALQKAMPISSIPQWIFASYNLSHSLVVFLLVFIIAYLITKKWFWPLTAWAIHILVDVPTHSTRFFATPFLWPVSDYRFNGISWATPWFMLLNYGTLLTVFLIIAHNRAKEKKTKFKK